MKFGLDEDTIQNFQLIFENYPELEEVIIYGSRAKGNYREGSDIDLILKGKKLTESIRSKIWLDLDGLNMPYLIDLSLFRFLRSDSLIKHIHQAGKLFYKKEEKDIF